MRVDRGSRPPVILDRPRLATVLTIQPDVLSGLARKEGVAARAVVRIGDADTLLDEERRAPGAERVFTHTAGAVEPPIDLAPNAAAKPESQAA